MKCYFAVEKPVDVIRNVAAFNYLVAFKYVMVVLLVCSSAQVFSQQWHSSSDTLKGPTGPTGYYTTIGYIARYKILPCLYTIAGSDRLHEGYKPVYMQTGQYFDKANTVGVFFNKHKRRVRNVACYCFR